MITIPSNSKWKKANNSDLYGNVYISKNIDFDEEGYLKLSRASHSTMNETVDTDFNRVASIAYLETGTYFVQTWDDPFSVGADVLADTPIQITGANFPVGSVKADSVWFTGKLAVSEAADLSYYEQGGGGWTDTNISLTSTSSTSQHPIKVFQSLSYLAVANVNTVGVYSDLTATPTLVRTLTIPADFEITSMAYFNQNLYIGTRHKYGARTYMFVWDGTGTAAQAAYEVDSQIIHDICMFQDSVVLLIGNGSLLRFNGAGFTFLDAFPIFYTDRVLTDESNIRIYHNSLRSNGEVIYISYSDSDNTNNFMLNQPSGIWCYDPKVGLYHKYSFSSALTIKEDINTADVDTATDQITVAAAPVTGTEVFFREGASPLNPLVDEEKYFVIKIDATHIKLAETKADALAGTAIDLTSTGNDTATELIFFPKTDYGVLFSERPSAISTIDYSSQLPQYGTDIIWAADTEDRDNLSNSSSQLGSVSNNIENRGYFVTPRYFSPSVTDSYNNISIKYSPLQTELDKIIIKYRTLDNGIREIDLSDWTITWTSTTTFTSTSTVWADAVAGNEVEILSGAGAGFLAHISTITSNAGTYTITLDEAFDNYASGDVARAYFANWTKLKVLTSSDAANDLGYWSVDLGKQKNGKFFQVKIELRGIGVKIEELLINNQTYLPSN